MDQEKALRQLMVLKRKSKKMRLAAEQWDSHWKILIATILSARTRDEKTIPLAVKLFEKFPNPKSLAKAQLSEVEKIIHGINFYKNKSRNIINCSKVLITNYKGEVPINEDRLINLPGVGRKTIGVFLSEIGKDAIGVDTHVSYISQKLNWTKNTNPNKIEQDLKKLFPKKKWKIVNPILVRFGKTYTSKKEKDKILNEI